MPNVSLTIFVDFLLSTGSRRIKRLRDWVDGPAYERKYDFWAKMRDWIVEAESGQLSRAEFKKRIESVTDTKVKRYSESANGFLKYQKKPQGEFIKAPRGEWTYADLTISINPELAYSAQGTRIAVKLYMKSERLSADKAALVGHLMKTAIPGFEPRVLDVKSGRLIVPGEFEDMDLLLRAEALAFTEVWKGIGPDRVPDDLRREHAKPQVILESESEGVEVDQVGSLDN
jgi:hypothetical protein